MNRPTIGTVLVISANFSTGVLPYNLEDTASTLPGSNRPMNLAAILIFSFVSPMLRMNRPSGRTLKMYFSISTVLIRVPMWSPAARSSSRERSRFSALGIASLSSMSWLSNKVPRLDDLGSFLSGDLRVLQELVDYLDMSYEHSSAAVSSDP